MGTKIRIQLLLLIIPLGMFGQVKYSELKKLAFNYCLVGNYSAIDSTFYNKFKDASSIQISIDGNFFENEDLKAKIDSFTISRTSKYYSQGNNLHFESENKNTIVCNCLQFYESKELDTYVKKVLKINSKKKSTKRRKTS